MSRDEDTVVIWHDVECGSYTADLPLWRELAAAAEGAVLDVGAGTGRVALDLAGSGFDVVALDVDERLLAALRRRAEAAGLEVETVCADAAGFELPGRSFGLVLVPMQTVQLLDGPQARGALLAAARAHLRDGGRIALALAPAVQPFEGSSGLLPEPDILSRDGVQYVSQPVAVRHEGDVIRLERRREARDGTRVLSHEDDVLSLHRLEPATLIGEGRGAGFSPEPPRPIAETDRHVGSEVVVLRA